MEATRRDVLTLAVAATLGAWPASAELGSQSDAFSDASLLGLR